MLWEEIIDVIAIRKLSDRGFDFFFNSVDGYHQGMCVEFYKTMKVDVFGRIKSEGQGKTIIVIADTIASYLHYV